MTTARDLLGPSEARDGEEVGVEEQERAEEALREAAAQVHLRRGARGVDGFKCVEYMFLDDSVCSRVVPVVCSSPRTGRV